MTYACIGRTVGAVMWVVLMLGAMSWVLDEGLGWGAVIPVAVAAYVGVRLICGMRRREAAQLAG